MLQGGSGKAGRRAVRGFGIAVVVLLGLSAQAAQAVPGRIYQLNGPYGCVNVGGDESCATGRGMRGAAAVAVSPDGHNVYVGSNAGSSLTTFLRSGSGKVVQPAGVGGCISEEGGKQCLTGRGLFGAFSVAVSPDGRNVYVASSQAVAAFARDQATGKLRQLPGADGCLAEGGGDGCAPARGLDSAASVAVSPDGRNVYVTAVDSSAVAAFVRDPDTGALTQLQGAAGCMSEGGVENCSTGHGLRGAFGIALSPSGGELYVSALRTSSVAVLARDPTTGALSQAPGAGGCLSENGVDGCGTARGISNPNGVAVAPDGRDVYVAASGSSAVAAFRRDKDGSLTQLAGARGCTSQGGREGCATGHALDGAFGIAASPDGKNVYVASLNALVPFLRDPNRGSLNQIRGGGGCVSEGGVEDCSTGRGLAQASSVALAPSGANAYVAAAGSAGLAVFARNPRRDRVAIHVRGMPPLRHCVSRRFSVQVRVSSLLPLRRVRVTLDGRRAPGRHGSSRFSVNVYPRELRIGLHRLHIKAADVSGARNATTERFRRCR